MAAEDNVPLQPTLYLQEQRVGIYRLRPWLDDPVTKQRSRSGFFTLARTPRLDFAVERTAANAKIVRRLLASPVIVETAQATELVDERLLIGLRFGPLLLLAKLSFRRRCP